MATSTDEKNWRPATPEDIETVIAGRTNAKKGSVQQTILELMLNHQGLVKEALVRATYNKFNKSSGIAITRSDINKELSKKLTGLSIQRGVPDNEENKEPWWIAIQAKDPTVELTKEEINEAINAVLNINLNPTPTSEPTPDLTKPASETPTTVQEPTTPTPETPITVQNHTTPALGTPIPVQEPEPIKIFDNTINPQIDPIEIRKIAEELAGLGEENPNSIQKKRSFEVLDSSEQTTPDTTETQKLKNHIAALLKEIEETAVINHRERYKVEQTYAENHERSRQRIYTLTKALEKARLDNSMPPPPKTLDEFRNRIEAITKEILNETDGIETHVVMDLIREMENIINKPSISPTIKSKCIQYREVLCYALSVTSGQTLLVPIANAIKTFMEGDLITTDQTIKVIAGISGRGPKVSIQEPLPISAPTKEVKKTSEQTGRIILRATTTQELQELIKTIASNHFETETENQPTRDDLIAYESIIKDINTVNQTQVTLALKKYLGLISMAIKRLSADAEIPCSTIQQLRNPQF